MNCSRCEKEIIEGAYIKACGKLFHDECFRCINCSRNIDHKEGFVNRQGNPWCETCVSNEAKASQHTIASLYSLSSPRELTETITETVYCDRCSRPITDQVFTRACGKEWHDECFACFNCDRVLGLSDSFSEREGQPWCMRCMHNVLYRQDNIQPTEIFEGNKYVQQTQSISAASSGSNSNSGSNFQPLSATALSASTLVSNLSSMSTVTVSTNASSKLSSGSNSNSVSSSPATASIPTSNSNPNSTLNTPTNSSVPLSLASHVSTPSLTLNTHSESKTRSSRKKSTRRRSPSPSVAKARLCFNEKQLQELAAQQQQDRQEGERKKERRRREVSSQLKTDKRKIASPRRKQNIEELEDKKKPPSNLASSEEDSKMPPNQLKNSCDYCNLSLVSTNQRKEILRSICRRLRKNDASLTRLEMQSCQLTQKESAKLISAINGKNDKVQSLDFSNGGFSSTDAENSLVLLCQFLASNTTITAVDLRGNEGLNGKSYKALVDAMKDNLTVVELFISPNPSFETEIQRCSMYINANCHLEEFLEGEAQDLQLSQRGLTEIPRQVITPTKLLDFTKITRLDFSHNNLQQIPGCINVFENLEILLVSHNQLNSVPFSLGQLMRLKKLDLSGNKLTSIPHSFTRLSSLEELYLADNQISQIPSLLGRLKSLSVVSIANNPIKGLPKPVITNGNKELLEHLQTLHNTSQIKKVYRSRILLLGHNKVGKTSLLKQLVQKKRKTKELPVDDKHVSITTWHAKSSVLPADKIEFSVWDLDCLDPMYYPFYSFFYCERCIYLVVFSLVDNESSGLISYWLQSIHARYPNALVFVVGTHYDDRRCTNEYVEGIFNFLLDRHSSLDSKLCCAVSTKTGRGIDEFRERLIETSLKQHYMPEYIPSIYLQIEANLKALRKKPNSPQVMSLDEFKETILAPAVGVTNILEQLEEIEFRDEITVDSESPKLSVVENTLATLSDLGLDHAIYYRQLSRGIVIVDPEWLYLMFSALVSQRNKYVVEGLLLESDVKKVWEEFGKTFSSNLKIPYANSMPSITTLAQCHSPRTSTPSLSGSVVQRVSSKSHITDPKDQLEEFALQLLVKFGLAFRLEAEKTVFIPSFITKTRPSPASLLPFNIKRRDNQVKQQKNTVIGRVYKVNYIPFGFASRLIVRFMETSTNPSLIRPRSSSKTPSFGQLLTTTTSFVAKASWKLIDYWTNGVIVSKSFEQVMLEVKPANQLLELSVTGPNAANLIASLVDNVDSLMTDWLQLNYQVFVPCTHCLSSNTSYDPFLFPLTDCESAAAEAKGYLLCRGTVPVRLAELVPDVVLHSFRGLKLDMNDIQFDGVIGEGAYATVFSGLYNGRQVAVKKLKVRADATTEIQPANAGTNENLQVFAEFRREVLLMSSLRHRNIVSLIGIVTEPEFCIVMERMNLGSLYDWLRNREQNPPKTEYINDEDITVGGLDWPTRLSIAYDIASGMDFLHRIQPPIIHRDLKSPNILVTMEKTEDSHTSVQAKNPSAFISNNTDPNFTAVAAKKKYRVVAKIADFGLSRRTLLTPALQKPVVDNPTWCAPETLRNEEYTEKVDVYSYGVILWELLTQRNFFGNVKFLSEVERLVKEGHRPVIPKCELKPYARLIRDCWHNNPARRPSFDIVLRRLISMSAGIFRPHIDPGFRVTLCREKFFSTLRNNASHTGSSKAIQDLDELEFGNGQAMMSEDESTGSGLEDSTEVESEIHTSSSFEAGPDHNVINDKYDIRSGLGCFLMGLQPLHMASVQCMCASRNNTVWSGTSNGYIRVTDITTRQPLENKRCHDKVIHALLLVGSFIWSASADKKIKVWKTDPGQLLQQDAVLMDHTDAVTCLERVGNEVWSGSLDMTVRLWDARRRKCKRIMKMTPAQGPPFCLLKFDKVNMQYAEITTTVWVGTDQHMLIYKSSPTSKYPQLITSFKAHSRPIHSLVVVANSVGVDGEDCVWSCSSDQTIKIWHATNYECLKIIEGHHTRVFSLCTDGKYVWSGGWDKTIMIWNCQGKFIRLLPEHHTDAVSGLLWLQHPGNGTQEVWSSSWDKSIILWSSD